MKVLHVHNFHRFGGGEDIMFDATVDLLRRNGIDVVTFTRDSKQLPAGVRGKMRAFRSGLGSSSAARDVAALIERERPDLAHIHTIYPLISPSAVIACGRAGLPVVMNEHTYRDICPTGLLFRKGENCRLCVGGREHFCVLTNCRGNLFESVAYALRTFVARKRAAFHRAITLYVSPSDFVRRTLVEAGFPAERFAVLPNFLTVPFEGLGQRGDTPGEYAAYVGRISPEKGVDTLIEAARGTGIAVRIAGDAAGMPELGKDAPDNVTFIGPLERQAIGDFLRAARFLVVPSKVQETFGLVATEAMANELPVIAARSGGLCEIVEDGVTGILYEPGNASQLGDAMRRLWDDAAMCRAMGTAGREKALREYHPDTYFTRLMGLYERAIALKKAAPGGADLI